MTVAQQIIISPEVYAGIYDYEQELKQPPYQCYDDTIASKVNAMKDVILQKASIPLTLPNCKDRKLGYEKNQDGTPKFPCFKSIIYKDAKSRFKWKFSVIYDASTGISTIYKMRCCRGVSKESAKWIPIQDFNKQIQEENTMKWKRLYNESQVDYDLEHIVDIEISKSVNKFLSGREYPSEVELKVYVIMYKIPGDVSWKKWSTSETYEDAEQALKSAQMKAKKANVLDVQFKIDEITIGMSKSIETVYEG